MANPENVVINDPGNPFHGQPAWMEDMHNNRCGPGGKAHSVLDHMRMTEKFRQKHNFPPEAAGLALLCETGQNGESTVTGHVMDQRTYENFLLALEGRPPQAEKNNWELIDDIVTGLVQSGSVDTEPEGADFLYDIVRGALYRHRPRSGPDDVWRDAIVEHLLEQGMIAPGTRREELEEVFTRTFSQYVYGYHPQEA